MQGARVMAGRSDNLHVSGHAYQVRMLANLASGLEPVVVHAAAWHTVKVVNHVNCQGTLQHQTVFMKVRSTGSANQALKPVGLRVGTHIDKTLRGGTLFANRSGIWLVSTGLLWE